MATKKLGKYQKMRDFSVTPEPSGDTTKKRRKKTIFVVQKHHASHLHYDFRLEMEGVLKSWAIPKGPSYDPGTKRLAMMTEDHPYDYAGFEGVIPEGNYGAGNVIVWDNGEWQFLGPGDDPVKAVEEGKLTFRLKGKKLFGEWALVKIRRPGTKGNEWLLLKHRDEFASENFDVTTFAPRSIVSDQDVDDLTPRREWQSNRAASSRRRAPTLADALKKASSKKKPTKKQATTKKGAARPSSRKATGGTKKKATAKKGGRKG